MLSMRMYAALVKRHLSTEDTPWHLNKFVFLAECIHLFYDSQCENADRTNSRCVRLLPKNVFT